MNVVYLLSSMLLVYGFSSLSCLLLRRLLLFHSKWSPVCICVLVCLCVDLFLRLANLGHSDMNETYHIVVFVAAAATANTPFFWMVIFNIDTHTHTLPQANHFCDISYDFGGLLRCFSYQIINCCL